MRTWAIWVAASIVGMAQFGCGSSDGGNATCSAFTACGGVIDGTWTISGVCPEGDVAQAMFVESGLPAACADLYQSANVSASGTDTYAGGTETPNVTIVTNAKVHMTAACVSAQAGGSTVLLSQPICDLLGTQLVPTDTTGISTTTATCKLAGAACDCDLVNTAHITQPGTYTTAGNILTDTTDPQKPTTQEYCVSGTTLRVRDTRVGGPVAMQFTAHK